MKYWLLLLAGLLPTLTHAGTVTLRDGQTLTGDVRLGEGKVVLTARPGGPAREIPLDQVARATFGAEPAAAPPVNPATDEAVITERSRKDKERLKEAKSGHVLAEYFEDGTYKAKLLTRFVSTFDAAWSPSDPPDPAVPGVCAVRYTARYVPPRTGDFTFTYETHGTVRLWIGGKLVAESGGKNSGRATDPIPLVASQPVDVTLEVTAVKWGFRSGLHVRGPGINNPYPSPEAFLPPPGAPEVPAVTIAAPADGAYFRSPAAVTLTADASGEVAKVEFVVDKSVVGQATRSTKGPFTFEWRNPPAGFHRVAAKVTTKQGVSQLSAHNYLAIAGQGKGGTLPAPWGEQTVLEKRREDHPVGGSTFDNGTFTLTKAGGQIPDNDDECHLVHQPVRGDFTLTARLASLAPPEATVGPVAGLIIKDRLSGEGKYHGAMVSATAVMASKRQEVYGRASNAERPLKDFTAAADDKGATAPGVGIWLKIQRHGNLIRTHASRDGKDWETLSNDRQLFPDLVYVGLCAMSRSLDTPAVAAFDHVDLKLGAPEMAVATPGILFASGTFLACDVYIAKDNLVYYNRAGREKLTVPASEVARLVYHPIPAEHAEKLPANATGVLLASGDFAEGEIKELSYRVTVQNVLFGARTFTVRGGDQVLAICYRDPTPAKARYTLTATDGSIYHTDTLKPAKDAVAIQDVTLGALEIPVTSLAEIRQ